MPRALSALFVALLVCACDAASPPDGGAPDVPTAIDSGAPDAPVDVGTTDTYASFAMGFFSTYCVECHSGPPSGRDYTSLVDVTRDAARIRCGTAPAGETQPGCTSPAAGMFPIGDGPFPSDDERRRLVAWIDAGLPE